MANVENSGLREETLRAETVYRGKIVDVEHQRVRLETGREAFREIVRHVPAAAAFVRHRDGRLILIRQFRKPAERVVLEIVAGILEPGEDPAAGARREVREETGYEPVRLEPLGAIFSSPGYVDERIDMFLVEVDGEPAPLNLDPDERVQPVALTEDEFRALVRRGEVVDGKTLAAWALVQCRAAGGGA